ncbi:MAG: hypothetical protein WDN29_04155 [Methylovirgula sp.]
MPSPLVGNHQTNVAAQISGQPELNMSGIRGNGIVHDISHGGLEFVAGVTQANDNPLRVRW